MKKLYALCHGITIFGIISTAILLMFMPDTIPAHYNFAGEVDRFGSKYENLLFLPVLVFIWAFFILIARYLHKKGEATNEKVVLYTAICSLLLCCGMSIY